MRTTAIPLVNARGVSKVYQRGAVRIAAVDKVDLSIAQRDFLAIVGASGSGKSTLLHMIGAVDVPSSGFLAIDGLNMATISDAARTLLRRRRIGFVFQSFNLLPMLNAEENVAMPLSLDRVNAKEACHRACEYLESFGMLERRKHLPHELSGGEQQRVAIARALVTRPALVLADEPTGSLDSANGFQVMQALRAGHAQGNHALVIVTHDSAVAAQADRTIRLRDGRILEASVRREHSSAPSNPKSESTE